MEALSTNPIWKTKVENWLALLMGESEANQEDKMKRQTVEQWQSAASPSSPVWLMGTTAQPSTAQSWP